MENEMQNRTENSPVIPPVKQGRSLEYAAGIDGFRSEILKAGLSLPNEIIDDGRILRFSSNGKPTETMLAGTSYSQTAFLQVHSAVGVKVLTSNGALVMKQN